MNDEPQDDQDDQTASDAGSARLRPMSDVAFRLMAWTMAMEDLFKNPRELVEQAPLVEGMTVVDYACGPGRYTIPAAEMVGPTGLVYAVDIQPLAIEMVRRKAEACELRNVEVVLVHSFDTGIAGGSVDLVLLIDAITPIRDHAALFAEIQRLLKPRGLLFMDASHMAVLRAVSVVAETGRFDLIEQQARHMLWRRHEDLLT